MLDMVKIAQIRQELAQTGETWECPECTLGEHDDYSPVARYKVTADPKHTRLPKYMGGALSWVGKLCSDHADILCDDYTVKAV